MKFCLLVKLFRAVQLAFVGIVDRHVVQYGPSFFVFPHARKQVQGTLIRSNGLLEVSRCSDSIRHQAHGISGAQSISSPYKDVVGVFADWCCLFRLFTVKQIHALLFSR